MSYEEKICLALDRYHYRMGPDTMRKESAFEPIRRHVEMLFCAVGGALGCLLAFLIS